MKTFVAAVNIFFTYLVTFILLCLFFDIGEDIFNTIFDPIGGNPLIVIIPLHMLIFIVNILFIIISWKGHWDAKALARTHLTVKLIQIPAYCFNFILGVFAALMILTIGITIAMFLFDIAYIVITGLFAIATFHNMKREGIISRKTQFLYSVLSFVFCVDLIIAILGYRNSKASGISENS